jgi:hypothetical protein
VVVDLHDPPFELEIVSKYAFFRSRELLLPGFPLLFVPSFARVFKSLITDLHWREARV